MSFIADYSLCFPIRDTQNILRLHIQCLAKKNKSVPVYKFSVQLSFLIKKILDTAVDLYLQFRYRSLGLLSGFAVISYFLINQLYKLSELL